MTFISATILSASASLEVPKPRLIFKPGRPLESLRRGWRKLIDQPGLLDRALLAVYICLLILLFLVVPRPHLMLIWQVRQAIFATTRNNELPGPRTPYLIKGFRGRSPCLLSRTQQREQSRTWKPKYIEHWPLRSRGFPRAT